VHFSKAAKRWQAQPSTVDFPVVLFRAANQDMWAKEFKFAADYGWRRYLANWLSIVSVAGGHISHIKAPHVSGLAREAHRFLARGSLAGNTAVS